MGLGGGGNWQFNCLLQRVAELLRALVRCWFTPLSCLAEKPSSAVRHEAVPCAVSCGW